MKSLHVWLTVSALAFAGAAFARTPPDPATMGRQSEARGPASGSRVASLSHMNLSRWASLSPEENALRAKYERLHARFERLERAGALPSRAAARMVGAELDRIEAALGRLADLPEAAYERGEAYNRVAVGLWLVEAQLRAFSASR